VKKQLNVFECTNTICNAMQKGILVTTKHADKVNSMTIGWGMIGIEWGLPIFIALIRESRFTREMLDKSGEFTVNIPWGDFDSKILGYCGTKSGRDSDKIKDLNLETIEGTHISAPALRQLPLTLECKVLYQQKQDLSAIPEDILKRYYPQDVDGSAPGKNRDCHIAYYAKIVDCYLVE